jgi:hypothetical protein
VPLQTGPAESTDYVRFRNVFMAKQPGANRFESFLPDRGDEMNALPSMHWKHSPVVLGARNFDWLVHCLGRILLRSGKSIGPVAVAFEPDDVATNEKRRETEDNATPDGDHRPIHAAGLVRRRNGSWFCRESRGEVSRALAFRNQVRSATPTTLTCGGIPGQPFKFAWIVFGHNEPRIGVQGQLTEMSDTRSLHSLRAMPFALGSSIGSPSTMKRYW